MAITEAKLFADVMQITQRKGNFDDADGSITDIDSAIWVSCLGMACQELTKDELILKQSASGQTDVYDLQSFSGTQIPMPSDFWLMDYLFVDNTFLGRYTMQDIVSGKEKGYAEEESRFILSINSLKLYNFIYYREWPIENGLPSTDLSLIEDRYYLMLLWQTCKQIYDFYGDDKGSARSDRMYKNGSTNIKGNAIKLYSPKAGSRP